MSEPPRSASHPCLKAYAVSYSLAAALLLKISSICQFVNPAAWCSQYALLASGFMVIPILHGMGSLPLPVARPTEIVDSTGIRELSPAGMFIWARLSLTRAMTTLQHAHFTPPAYWPYSSLIIISLTRGLSIRFTAAILRFLAYGSIVPHKAKH